MSFDILTVKRIDENVVKYSIACSCCPSALGEYGDETGYSTTFEHIDGVFIDYDFEGDAVFYDVTKKIIRTWIVTEDDECIVDLNIDVWTEYAETLKNLNMLFGDHWPSLGEIADVLSLTV